MELPEVLSHQKGEDSRAPEKATLFVNRRVKIGC